MEKGLLFHLDDSLIARKIFQRNIEEIGQLIGAQSIVDAEKILMNLPNISCFIVDYHLMDGDGLDFVRKIRNIEKYKNIPVILYTATLTNDIAFKAFNAGVNESISKQVNYTKFKEILKAQIEDPHVKVITKEYYEVSCASWHMNGKCFQYCPAINIFVSADSAEDVEIKMKKILEDEVNVKKHNVGELINISSVIHRIDVK